MTMAMTMSSLWMICHKCARTCHEQSISKFGVTIPSFVAKIKRAISNLQNGVRWELEVTQAHWKWYRYCPMDHIGYDFGLPVVPP